MPLALMESSHSHLIRSSDPSGPDPGQVQGEDLKTYFAALVESHSWSTVKTDRNGLQFFWKHVLGKHWDFVEIIKPPTVKRLPVILTPAEIERMLNTARKLRYYTILLTLYSMGLRLAEGLNLTIADIDSEMKLSDITAQYGDRFLEKYSHRLLPGHIKALQAIQHCRTPAAGMTLLECNGCRTRDQKPMSCGHRHCNRCQNTDTSEWLQRQGQKLLPVEYFMVTFSYLNSKTGKKET